MIMQIIISIPSIGCCSNHKQPISGHCNTHNSTQIITYKSRRRSVSSFYSSDKHSQTQYKTNSPTPINIENNKKKNIYSHQDLFLGEMYSFLDNNSTNNKNKKNPNQQSAEVVVKSEVSEKLVHRGISSNMWWQKLRAALSQRLNLEGISSAMAVMTREQNLVIPHITVKDIRLVDWVELEKKGFRGVVFDKDNTLTEPYSHSLWPPLESSVDCCKSVFGDNVAVFSNSAGLHQYDADGLKARAIEDSIGIHVLRHGVKKPGGSAEDIEKYFGCSASLLIMVGDRYLTDVVYGNRNGFLTILTEPLSLVKEPFIVKQDGNDCKFLDLLCMINACGLALLVGHTFFAKSKVRKLEASLANYWFRRGVKPVCHNLLSEAMQCVKIPPPV